MKHYYPFLSLCHTDVTSPSPVPAQINQQLKGEVTDFLRKLEHLLALAEKEPLPWILFVFLVV